MFVFFLRKKTCILSSKKVRATSSLNSSRFKRLSRVIFNRSNVVFICIRIKGNNILRIVSTKDLVSKFESLVSDIVNIHDSVKVVNRDFIKRLLGGI